MLIAWVERGIKAKVYTDAAAHKLFTIKLLADGDSRVYFEEGDDNSFERLEWRPGVDCSILIDRFANLDKL